MNPQKDNSLGFRLSFWSFFEAFKNQFAHPGFHPFKTCLSKDACPFLQRFPDGRCLKDDSIFVYYFLVKVYSC
ncbi:hypothetical protein B4096_1704 [Heyndrickxia coagulans]|nr:hypothetical protein B4096_1704 [Heyndrickxia coagulans]